MLHKSTEAAIAAMSLLAEVYDAGERTLTAAEIAEQRSLQKPFVAKLLVGLSQAGLIRGTPGRHGGYRLARPPEQIALADIAACFERRAPLEMCPFGQGHCGHGKPCPLHKDILRLRKDVERFLGKTTLAVFKR